MSTNSFIYLIIGCTLASIGFVVILFSFSENELDYNNSFLRRYPHHPATRLYGFELGFNSYYIAGVSGGKIFLGNRTAPLHLISLDIASKDTCHLRIKLQDKDFPFRNVKIAVQDTEFFLYDGTVPVIFKGPTNTFSAVVQSINAAFFSDAQPISPTAYILRVQDATSGDLELSKLETKTGNLFINENLIDGEIDGFFDSDGSLLYNSKLGKIIYVYRYRNNYLVLQPDLKLISRGKTIDTTKKAYLNLIVDSSLNQVKIGPNAITVNNLTSSFGNYLFINSPRIGKHEDPKQLESASIIDVYEIKSNSYYLSFYLYHNKNEKITDFNVHENFLFAVVGSRLIIYNLKEEYFERNKDIRASIRGRSKT